MKRLARVRWVVAVGCLGAAACGNGAVRTAGDGGSGAGYIHLASLGDGTSGQCNWFIVFRTTATSYADFGEVRTGCTVTESGACTLYQCDDGSTSDANIGATITVAGGHQDMSFDSSTSNDSYVPNRFDSLQVGFVGGETLTYVAPGGDAPALHKTLVAPTAVVLTAPDVSTGAMTIDRGVDLEVTWTGGVAGDTLVVDTGTQGWAASRLRCLFDATAGTATVPAAALGLLPAGRAYFGVITGRQEIVAAGGWSTALQLSHEARDGAGNRSYVPATLE